VLQMDRGEVESAIQSLEIARQAYRASLPDGHPYRVFPLATTANLQNKLGRHQEAETSVRTVLDNFYASLSEGHSGIVQAKQILIEALLGQEKYGEIEPILEGHYRYTSEDGPSTAYRSSVNRYIRDYYEATDRPVPEPFRPAVQAEKGSSASDA